MLSFTELNTQNHQIMELSKVLFHVISKRSLCDTAVVYNIFIDYINAVKIHLDHEERELYSDLLTHKDSKVKITANKFLSGSKEIKHVLKVYFKQWCRNKHLRIKDHDAFIKDSREVFDLVNNRISDEVEHFYPMIRSLS